jgi:hypothetical protein
MGEDDVGEWLIAIDFFREYTAFFKVSRGKNKTGKQYSLVNHFNIFHRNYN